MAKGRVYTQQQYDDATRRISKLVNIERIKNIQELDRQLKKERVYHDVKGGLGTIYDQLLDNWKDHVEPSQLIKQEKEIRKRQKKKAFSQRKIRQQRREMNRLNGVSYYREENKIKIKKIGGEVRQYILHQGRYHRLENIIVYNRTYISKKTVTHKWHTRKKPVKKKKKNKKSNVKLLSK
jgi:hypothetical protein